MITAVRLYLVQTYNSEIYAWVERLFMLMADYNSGSEGKGRGLDVIWSLTVYCAIRNGSY